MAARLLNSVDGVIARLEQKGGRAVKAVNDAMAAGAQVIYQEIWDRMPVEYGNLESALKVESNLRKSWIIGIDGSVPSHDGKYTVGDYAARLNETNWEPGQASRDKGGDVGPKFMERGLQAAIDDGIIDNCKDALDAALASKS